MGPEAASTPASNADSRHGTNHPGTTARGRHGPPGPGTGAGEITSAWGRSVKAERVAWSMLAQALKNQSPDAPRMLALHSQACRHLIDNRERFVAQAERERQLVSGDWVRRVMQEHDGVLAQLLRSMPKQLAGRIAPHDPGHAEMELHRWVQETVLKTLHGTDPWA